MAAASVIALGKALRPIDPPPLFKPERAPAERNAKLGPLLPEEVL